MQSLPIDGLKFDRSFVMAMERDESAAVIVSSIVNLAHSLGLSVVAEGVESQAAFDRLRELGCDQAQGYSLGRPMEARTFLTWVGETRWGPTLPARADLEENSVAASDV